MKYLDDVDWTDSAERFYPVRGSDLRVKILPGSERDVYIYVVAKNGARKPDYEWALMLKFHGNPVDPALARAVAATVRNDFPREPLVKDPTA